MGGYNVYADDLIYLGATFKKVAVEYRADMPDAGFQAPSAGGGQIDSVLYTALRMAATLHSAIAEATWQHGEKLQLVAERYQNAEKMSLTRILQESVYALTTPGEVPKLSEE